MEDSITRDNLWKAITRHEGETFYTIRGLEFHYTIKGNQMMVDRKRKSLTRSTFELAFDRLQRGPVSGPKELCVFGAPYIWVIFKQLGVIKLPLEYEISDE